MDDFWGLWDIISMPDKSKIYIIAMLIIAALAFYFLWQLLHANAAFDSHPMLANVRFKKLPLQSSTRKRLTRASELFQEGWKVVMGNGGPDRTPEKCLALFARAVEIDEACCGWKGQWEAKLSLVGSLFAAKDAPSGKDDLYTSFLAEAYFVLLLYKVVEIYGKPSDQEEEDFKVVKSRLDECCKLQPKNAVIFKLRGDWTSRFPNHSNVDQSIKDLRMAIRLCESDPDASHLYTEGVDKQEYREFVLTSCHFVLASLLQRKQDWSNAAEHYRMTLKHADEDYIQLADTHYSLVVLTFMMADGGADAEGRKAILNVAKEHLKKGDAAVKRLRRWMPTRSYEVPRRLALGLVAKFREASYVLDRAEAEEAKLKREEARRAIAEEAKKGPEEKKKD